MTDDDDLVLDASVWINLLATGSAEEIFGALPQRLVVIGRTTTELLRHPLDGGRRGNPIDPYLESGSLESVVLSGGALETFIELVGAAPPDDLGDGEAATLAHAHDVSSVAVIDERKARRISTERFPDLQVVSTVDLLRHDAVASALRGGLGDAVLSALQHGRMRVPPVHEEWVIEQIGRDNARQCPSLPRRLRMRTR